MEPATENLIANDKKMVVVCKDVGKHFHVGKETLSVLDGLNLSIPQGTIFSLLGPSGCGKTTLLKCVIGRTVIDEGILRVFDKDPTSKNSGLPGPTVGYMPQVIALNDYLTITETLVLYGKLFGMKNENIEKRSKTLLDVLQMSTHRKKIIQKLSVGQQRRISFAVALLNESPLLILDEPTVGVDPVLRQSIWNYLTNFVKRSNTTVIITTHYIEEAIKSHSVGLLLYGHLLAQASPEELMRQHCCPTLEDVFLKLCITKLNVKSVEGDSESIDNVSEDNVTIKIGGDAQENNLNDCLRMSDPTESTMDLSFKKKCKCGSVLVKMKKTFRGGFWEGINIGRLLALSEKNVKDMLRFPIGLICLLLLPALSMLIFPLTIGNELHDIPLGVVNDDYGDDSLGSLYLNSLNKHIIKQISYENYTAASHDASMGRIMGIIVFRHNFTDAFMDRFGHGVLAEENSFENGNIFVALNYNNHPVAVSIYFELVSTLEKFVKSVLTRIGMNPKLGTVPIQQLTDVFGEVQYDFQRYVAPTFLLILVSLFVMCITAVLTVIKRDSGHFDRFYTSGVTSIELILSEAFSQMIFMIPQVSLILIVMFAVNGFYNHGSYVLVILLVILQYMCGLSLGFFIIGLSPDLITSMAFMVTLFIFVVLTQGLFWPLEGMPYAFRCVFQLGYFALPGDAMRFIVNHGWDLTNLYVLGGFAVSIVWTIIFLFFGWLGYRLKA